MNIVTKKLENIRSRATSTEVSRAKSSLSQKSDQMVELMVLGLRKGASSTIARTSTVWGERAKYRNLEQESACEIEDFKSRAKSR